MTDSGNDKLAVVCPVGGAQAFSVQPSADQTWTYEDYRAGRTELPMPNLAWNTYGKGVENVGRDGKPEAVDLPVDPGPDQLLIRIDAVGLCFSDVKLIRQGGDHPKLYGRDLSVEPTRLGHEAAVTVIAVGADHADTYSPGDRLAIQPDIHVDGRSTAYGYTIPGGLVQYHLIGPEVLDADDGAYVIPIADEIGYASGALSEPWACVEASYTQRRRLEPLAGGTMWIVGRSDDTTLYRWSAFLDRPGTVVLTDVSDSVASLVEAGVASGTEIIRRDGIAPGEYGSAFGDVAPEGFDDIVVLDPRSADQVEAAAPLIAFRGTMNLVGTEPLDGKPALDVGRLHYHYTAFVGTNSGDVAASYGEDRNRAELRPRGVAVFVGAAGPMGQMHMQRAIELPDGPRLLLAIDLDDHRIEATKAMLGDLAVERGRELVFFNPTHTDETQDDFVRRMTGGAMADDVVVSVPVGPVMAGAAELMGPDGMFVAFAGVPNGTLAPLDASNVYLANAQFTGTSGSSIEDQASVLGKAERGELTPSRSLAAVGGIDAGQAGVQAMLDGDFAGKIMIFPQASGLPLMGLADLAEQYPEIGAALGEGGVWTEDAERLLLSTFAAPDA